MIPTVTIVLPTYNRASFLPEALQAIACQTFADWELVVVDDGSTDSTADLLAVFQTPNSQPLVYVRQANAGAYAARNRGIDLAKGRFIAHYDSDDLWAPDYLARTVGALERRPELDWVFTACRRVNTATGDVLEPSTFHVKGVPRPFLSLRTRDDGDLHVIVDRDVLQLHINHGLYAGLQNSVIRSRVFVHERFWPDYRVVEDVFFLLRALTRGTTVGYLDGVYVTYRVHEDNSSASASNNTSARLEEVCREQIRACERVLNETPLPRRARNALRRQLSHAHFWRLGYSTLWKSGQFDEALVAFRDGLRTWPWQLGMWKSYIACTARRWFTARGARSAASPPHA